eukprot:TRINITY_DN520_c0_g1_i13.p1 TRINITY_DN520_c0_g1~~TRINITY_DN520_c0_g1_i13.p1  ORF type:complete len:116 (+),score=7.80 TRINITY_DN520_c0_g1_i13:397-744(+)
MLKSNVVLNRANVVCTPYYWGTDVSLLPTAVPARFVIAADVVYREDTFLALLVSLRLLTDHQSIVIIAYKQRSSTEATFWTAISHEFDCVSVDGQSVWNDCDPSYSIRTLRRCCG